MSATFPLRHGASCVKEAKRSVQTLKARIERVRSLVADIQEKPRVFCLELVSKPPATALGRAASRVRREERGVLEDEYASDEQRRAATQIGPAPWLTRGCGGRGPAAASLLLAVLLRVRLRRRSWHPGPWRSQRGSREVLKPTLEWLKPLMASGPWVPEMVEMAGGIEVLGQGGLPSCYVSWEEIVEARPEILILMPCGFPIERTKRELPVLCSRPGWDTLPAVRQHQVYLANGPAYYNRAGPRLVDGLEILAGLIHPECCQGFVLAGAAERWDGAYAGTDTSKFAINAF